MAKKHEPTDEKPKKKLSSRERTALRKEEEARKKRNKNRLIIAGVVFIIIAIAGFAAFQQWNSSRIAEQGPEVVFEGDICDSEPLLCELLPGEFRDQFPEEYWGMVITVRHAPLDPGVFAQVTWEEDNPIMTIATALTDHTINADGIRELAGHEGFHTTSINFEISTNIMMFDTITKRREPITGIRGYSLSTDSGFRTNIFEEGAAFFGSGYGPLGNENYEWSRDYMGSLFGAAGWSRVDAWIHHDEPDVFVNLCEDAYQSLFDEQCDAAVFEAMIWRLPAYILGDENILPSDLTEWQRFSNEVRASYYNNVITPIEWEVIE